MEFTFQYGSTYIDLRGKGHGILKVFTFQYGSTYINQCY